LGLLTLAGFEALAGAFGFGVAAAAGGLVLLAARVLACAVASYAKLILVGVFQPGERPLWSSFVWRNELADTFIEVLAVPWLAGAVGGTPGWVRGCAVSAPGSAAAFGAKRTGCRRLTSSGSATRPRSTGAPSCRPTCSMIESCAWTR